MNITFHKSILGLCLLFLTILQVSAQTFDPAKYYQIANKVSNKVLEVKDASTAEGAQIFQWAAVTGKANQLWQVKKRADGSFNFVSKSSGKMIDADDCTEGSIIKQYAADGTNSQNWKLETQTDGSFKILNQTCNKYIRLESGSSADGASVGIKNDFGTDAFKWLIKEVTTTIDPTGGCWQTISSRAHTLALKTNGTLWAWGYGSTGSLGNGSTDDRGQISPIQVGTASDWAAVSSGFFFSVALKKDGSLWTWGGRFNASIPTRFGTANDWLSISGSGSSYVLALKKDGSLWIWGYWRFQEITTPLRVGTSNNWLSISAGDERNYAIQKDGSLWAWGNSDGFIGDGEPEQYIPEPTRIGTANWKLISSKSDHTVGIQADGSLWAWGLNPNGILGDGTTTDRKTPIRIGTANNWQTVSTGFYSTLAIKTDGSLWGWGQNTQGELGDGTLTSKNIPTRIGTATNWQSVEVPSVYSLAIKKDNTLWGAGFNTDGYLGIGSTSNKTSFTQVSCSTDSPLNSGNVKNVFVFQDNNDNNKYDTGDSPLSGVSVTLKDAQNKVVSVTQTNVDGSYSFLEIPKGNYTISFPPLLDINNVTITNRFFGVKGLKTQNAIAFTLSAGQTFSNADAAYTLLGTIEGKVVEVGVPLYTYFGALDSITLRNSRNEVVMKAIAIDYFFGSLEAGTYTISFPTERSNGRILTTSNPMKVTLGKGQNFKVADAIYSAPTNVGGITGRVAYDANNNGVIECANRGGGYCERLGYEGVSVTVKNSAGQVIRSGVTDANGQFSFTKLQPATYTLTFPNNLLNDGRITTTGGNTRTVNVVVGDLTSATVIGYYFPIPTDSTVCYRIVNIATKKVLEVKDGLQADSTPIVQWTASNSRLQQLWKIKEVARDPSNPNIYYAIQSARSGKVMAVKRNDALFGACSDGDIVTLLTYNGTDKHRWTLGSGFNGFVFYSRGCGRTLEVKGASILDGATVDINNTSSSNKWILQKVNCTTGAALSATAETFGFEAHASEGRAKLQWITNTGYKNDYFEIERLNANGSFDILSRQNAYAGDDMKSYTFTDNDPLDGDNFYRINAVSNGNTPPQYSEVKKVSFSKNEGINIFPNPADEFINVDLRKYEGKTVALSIYNSVGLLVKKQTIEKVSAAPQQIDVQGFGTGSYLLRVQSEGKREVTRLFHIAK